MNGKQANITKTGNLSQLCDFLYEIYTRLLLVLAVLRWLHPGVKIRRALGPMARKIASRPSKLTLGGPARPADFGATVIPLYVS